MGIEYCCLVGGPLATSCYIVWDADTRAAAIIDPGGSREEIVARIAALDLCVERVLLTHGHPDHCFYAGDIALHYGVGVAMHEADVPLLTDELAELFYDISAYVRFAPSEFLRDGDVIALGASEIKVLHTPGHSQGGLCFETAAGVFCGDTIFAGSVGRTDLLGGSHEELMRSIEMAITPLPDSTPLYPGHGPATTVGNERIGNPFLQ